ncbi:porin [Massilia rhizosphaerae]|uniref:porin n=1 Tax=Massilia rhizosphaerae TaxID=2784389 RepID=UPI0018DD4B97|nr:porin [Massilia rhizosphaerae]
MKKSLLLLAVSGVFAGTASAQSSTTVYGLINIGLVYSKSDVAPTRWGVDSGGWWGSRLGFRGSEDLGNGTSVIYQLENGFSPDTGTAGQGGRIFGRQSWVGLKGDFGTVRFGRTWTPSYCLLTDVIDPFEDGMSGAAESFFGRNIYAAIDIRTQNAVFYAKQQGPLKAEVSYAFGETAGSMSANRQISGAFTYTAGKLKLAYGYQNNNDANGTGAAKLKFVGANYDFGFAKLHFGLDRQKTDAAGLAPVDASDLLLGLTIPAGGGRILASYNRLNDRSARNADMAQYALGYTYALSKRTALFTSIGHIDPKNANRMDWGIRHMF